MCLLLKEKTNESMCSFRPNTLEMCLHHIMSELVGDLVASYEDCFVANAKNLLK